MFGSIERDLTPRDNVFRTDKVTHTCTGCGDGSVFCCSTSKDGKPTQGMEKH